MAHVHSRRAIVKTRVKRLGGKGLTAAHAHLRYILRGSVQRDGSPGELYSAGDDVTDGKRFLERCTEDRHQFRLIASPEDGAEYQDLKPLIRSWMARMEADLGTRLDWVAADHFDTAHPHTHIILRGKDDKGEDLVITRNYIACGMRERLADQLNLDLGPRIDSEIERNRQFDVGAERLTAIDQNLISEAGTALVISAGHPDPFRHAHRAGRLKKLEALGFAEDLGGARWRLDARLEQRLIELGERGDTVREMQRVLSARGLDRPPSHRAIHPVGVPFSPIVGRVIESGVSNKAAAEHYLVLDGTDGRVHHFDMGPANALEPLIEGMIVRVSPVEHAAFQQEPAERPGLEVEILSHQPLERLLSADGPTWLDKELISDKPEPLRDSGFGGAVRSALNKRREWLEAEQLISHNDGGYPADRIGVLRRRELLRVAADLLHEVGIPYPELVRGAGARWTVARSRGLEIG